MYCENCGTKLNGNEDYCFRCGRAINKVNSSLADSNSNDGMKNASIVLGIISLVGIFFIIFCPISLILSLIGLILSIKANKMVNNVAGIVINAIGLFISSVITFLMIMIIVFVIDLGQGFIRIRIPFNNYIQQYEDRF